MPTVHYIERTGAEADFKDGQPFAVERGESAWDLMRRLGYQLVKTEQVPAAPRKLDPRAAEFIRDCEREEPNSVLAVYWRYHSLEAEEFDTAEEAKGFLENGVEWGSLAPEAIVDGDQIRVWD